MGPSLPQAVKDKIKWVDVQRNDDFDAIKDKIEVGNYNGHTWYVSRVKWNGDNIGGCYSYDHRNVMIHYKHNPDAKFISDSFQVATGDLDARRYFKWVTQSGNFTLSKFPAHEGIPIPAGEFRGRPAYIARTRVQSVKEENGNGILPFPIFEGEQVHIGSEFRLESQDSSEYEVLSFELEKMHKDAMDREKYEQELEHMHRVIDARYREMEAFKLREFEKMHKDAMDREEYEAYKQQELEHMHRVKDAMEREFYEAYKQREGFSRT